MPPYSLSGVCKALVHMAWSVLPEEKRSDFSYIYDWVNNKIEILPLVFRLTYGHKILSFYLPKNTDVSNPPNALKYFKHIPSDTLVECIQLKIKSEQQQQPSECTFTMSYTENE